MDIFNLLNHATFNPVDWENHNAVPVSRAGVDLSGPIPYFVGATASKFPTGSQESIRAQYYRSNAFMVSVGAAGRIVQLSLRVGFCGQSADFQSATESGA